VIENGKQVAIEYTLTLDDGTTVDTNVGKQPLKYKHGTGEILPALESALDGLDVDARRSVTLEPEQGYGKVDPEAFRKVPVSMVPEDARKVGTRLVAEDPSGQQHQLKVHEVGDEEVTLDLNHPLAGETLHFDIRVVAVD
jgi:FKBP-type peptidyl-prolyl cis-trans isomerase 2